MDDSRSKLAEELEELRRTVFETVRKRERLPQPLFWSLFHARIKRMRGARERERELKKLLLNPYLDEQ